MNAVIPVLKAVFGDQTRIAVFIPKDNALIEKSGYGLTV